MQTNFAQFRPQIEHLLKRSRKKAARAARTGDHKAAAGWTRASAHLKDALAHLPEPHNEEEEAEALRAELRRRIELFTRDNEEDDTLLPNVGEGGIARKRDDG